MTLPSRDFRWKVIGTLHHAPLRRTDFISRVRRYNFSFESFQQAAAQPLLSKRARLDFDGREESGLKSPNENPWSDTLAPERLLQKLTGGEDDTVERKPKNQPGDYLQTAVAFANSLPVDAPGILFYGASDAGEGQLERSQLEREQKGIVDRLKQIYPPLPFKWCVQLETDNGKGCIAVIVTGSAERPHFAGQSYVRIGPQNVPASAQQFELLIASRSGKVRAILTHKGKQIKCFRVGPGRIWRTPQWGDKQTIEVTVEDCTAWYVTLSYRQGANQAAFTSYPLSRVEISRDHIVERHESRLQLEIHEDEIRH